MFEDSQRWAATDRIQQTVPGTSKQEVSKQSIDRSIDRSINQPTKQAINQSAIDFLEQSNITS